VDKEGAEMLNKYTKVCQEHHQELENEKAAREQREPKVIKELHYEVGMSFAPRRFSLEMLEIIKSTMTDREWNSLYLQKPMADGGNILKAEHWQEWPHKTPPVCEYIVQSYDTAFETGEENDYTARTTWGIFKHQDHHGWTRLNAILLEAYEERVTFPDLRAEAMRSYKEYDPDYVLIEGKASGLSLIQELRVAGLPVRKIKVDKDKVARAHSGSVVLEKGGVWYMSSHKQAARVIDQCSIFPFGKHDDLVDTVTQLFNWLRKIFNIQLADDGLGNPKDDEPDYTDPRDKKGGVLGC